MKVIDRNTNYIGDISRPIVRVRVLDDSGTVRELAFDHDPTDDELALQLPPPPRRLAPTQAAGKAALKDLLDAQIGEAQSWEWFAAKVSLDVGVPAAAKTAVQALADAEYAEAKRLALAWRQAT